MQFSTAQKMPSIHHIEARRMEGCGGRIQTTVKQNNLSNGRSLAESQVSDTPGRMKTLREYTTEMPDNSRYEMAMLEMNGRNSGI